MEDEKSALKEKKPKKESVILDEEELERKKKNKKLKRNSTQEPEIRNEELEIIREVSFINEVDVN